MPSKRKLNKNSTASTRVGPAKGKTPEIWSVFVTKAVESGNKSLYRQWYVYENYKKEWYRTLSLCLPKLGKAPNGIVAVSILSKRGRLLDYGNFVQGCKPILDYLKHSNYIHDDSPKWIDDSYKQVLWSTTSERGTQITIQYLF